MVLLGLHQIILLPSSDGRFPGEVRGVCDWTALAFDRYNPAIRSAVSDFAHQHPDISPELKGKIDVVGSRLDLADVL